MTSTSGGPIRLMEPGERFGTVSSATAAEVHAAGLGPHGFAVYCALTMFVDPADGPAEIDDLVTITGLTTAEVEAAVEAGEAAGMWGHTDLTPFDPPPARSSDEPLLTLDLPPSPYDLLPGSEWLRRNPDWHKRTRHLRPVQDESDGGAS